MVREIKQKNLLQVIRQTLRELGVRSVASIGLMVGLIIVISVTFFLAQQEQDNRQQAATTLVNCSISNFSMDSEEQKMLSLINEFRRGKGLAQLTLSSHLNRAAEWKSQDMSRVGTSSITHNDSLGRKFNQRIYDCGYPQSPGFVGENLAANNYKPESTGGSKINTTDKAMEGWKNSPTHYENLVFPSWNKIGISRVLNSNGLSFWSTEYGEYNDGTSGQFIFVGDPPGQPSVQSAVTACRDDGSVAITFNFTTGANATSHELVYNPGSWNSSGAKVSISPGQSVPSASQGGFSQNQQIYYNIQSCNGNGCVFDSNGYYIVNTGSCSSLPTPTPTTLTPPTPTKTPVAATTCNYSSSNNFSILAGSNKEISVTAFNLLSGLTDLGFTSGTDKLFKIVNNTVIFNPTMSLTAPISSYNAPSGGSYIFNMNLTTTTLTPIGQYTLDAIYLYLNGTKTQCIYNGLGGLVINVQSAGGGGGGEVAIFTPTPTKLPTPTVFASSTPTSIPFPTPTPITYAPQLLLWSASCANGFANIGFNWTGTNPYGYTLRWGSPWIYNNPQTISYARSGTIYQGFSPNVDIEYQVWANNSFGQPVTPSSNGSFVQRTPSCFVIQPTPTPTIVTTSSCPNFDPTTGYNNICTTNPCPGGSVTYKSGSGNLACASTYGSSYGNCCMVNQPNGCPGDGFNACRQTGCFAGETNLTNGNAACASAFGWRTGYCCR